MRAELFYRNLRHYGAQADFVVAPPALVGARDRPIPTPAPGQLLVLPNYDNTESYSPLFLYMAQPPMLVDVSFPKEAFSQRQREWLDALETLVDIIGVETLVSSLRLVAFVRKLAAGGPVIGDLQAVIDRVRDALNVGATDEADAWRDRLESLVASRLGAIKLAQLYRPRSSADDQALYARRLRDRVWEAYTGPRTLVEAEPLCAQTLSNMLDDWRQWH